MILGTVVFWYGLIPAIGGIILRNKWYRFRKHFNEFRLCPILDYDIYRKLDESDGGGEMGKSFRFLGKFESVTEGQVLWVRSESLTVPVLLKNADTYLLQMISEDSAPQKIRWEIVSTLSENAKVCVCGAIQNNKGQWNFTSTKKNPLIIFFYDGPDNALASHIVRVCRQRDEYWNSITPYSLAMGVLCHFLFAVLFL